jgi:hypothetical protein
VSASGRRGAAHTYLIEVVHCVAVRTDKRPGNARLVVLGILVAVVTNESEPQQSGHPENGVRREFTSHVVGAVLAVFCRAVKRKFGGADLDRSIEPNGDLFSNHDCHDNGGRYLKLPGARSI